MTQTRYPPKSDTPSYKHQARAISCVVAAIVQMDELRTSIAGKKERIDALRPLSPQVLVRLEHYYDIELAYTSNAIEGNTLSPVETTLVIEKGITIGGKPLKDHLEALDHYDAIRYVREPARQGAPLTESDVRNLHRPVLQRSSPDNAGRYADLPRYIRTETGRQSLRTHGNGRIMSGGTKAGKGKLRTMPRLRLLQTPDVIQTVSI